MSNDDYTDGTETALLELGLTKVAFMGAVRALGSRAAASPLGTALKDNVVGPASHALNKYIGQPATQAFKKHIAPVSDAMGRGITQAGNAVESAGVGGARRLFGESGAQAASTVLKGAPAESIRQGVGGALIGGGFQGSIDAATAEEGQRGDAFLKGMGQGAASGAAFGVLGGVRVTSPKATLPPAWSTNSLTVASGAT
jgi:hypothetical protein